MWCNVVVVPLFEIGYNCCFTFYALSDIVFGGYDDTAFSVSLVFYGEEAVVCCVCVCVYVSVVYVCVCVVCVCVCAVCVKCVCVF